jgi:hypothetical protein
MASYLWVADFPRGKGVIPQEDAKLFKGFREFTQLHTPSLAPSATLHLIFRDKQNVYSLKPVTAFIKFPSVCNFLHPIPLLHWLQDRASMYTVLLVNISPYIQGC